MAAGIWRVWAETGGTFTDCVAVDPGGGLHRAKVLSSGALRGSVVDVLAPDRLRISERWGAPGDFVRGMRLSLLGARGAGAGILAYDPKAGALELDSGLAAAPGAAFEVRFPFEAPVLAARLVTATPPDRPLPPMALRVATTRGTNALLTRRGTPPALFVTDGFADLLEIGTQQRPDLFALDIVKPAPLAGAVFEVPGRLAADGSVVLPLDEAAVVGAAQRLRAEGFATAAVALLHSYKNPAHERRVADILRAEGFTHVSVSSDLAPFIKLLPRAQTAVVNAYLAPILDAYVAAIGSELPPAETGSTLHVLTSAGGLVRAADFRPKDGLLSGPAGGVVGAALAARRSGLDRILAFDMGGTSTDVARCDAASEAFDYVFEHRVGDAHLVAPAVAVESVAAGGGSICFVERRGLRVGPESAGASPGPACYGAGGPLTLTDVNLLLGRLDPSAFEIPVARAPAEAAADALVERLYEETGERLTRDALLRGFLDIADERMADAIRTVSVRRGYDPAEHALVAFGGAGAQHACAVASRLGIKTVLVPADASLLSALGLGHAPVERIAERQLLLRLDTPDAEAAVLDALRSLADEAARAVAAEGFPAAEVAVRRRIVNLRLAGQESTLAVEHRDGVPLRGAFAAEYAAVFGRAPGEGQVVEAESARVVAGALAVGASGALTPGPSPAAGEGGAEETALPPSSSPLPSRSDNEGEGPGGEGSSAQGVRAHREALPVGARIEGPALIFERHSATVVAPGWTATVDDAGALLLTAREGEPPRPPIMGGEEGAGGPPPDPVARELFAARFAAVAEEMGEMLRRTALSVNVKERLDFSCAVLDPAGDLVASAAHIPVHLGALGLCVRRLRESIEMSPGDVVVTNHPAFGGSHLPDVTVVTPVFGPPVMGGPALLGYVASRAHHSEIGGTRPGSMPPDATTLAEEGVVIPPTHLFRAGEPRWGHVRGLLTSGSHPTRAPADNLADLEAAVAANRRGAAALTLLAERHGPRTVTAQMAALAARADAVMRDALRRLPAGTHRAEDALDDGTPLRVTVTLPGDGTAAIDFAGTGAVHPGNLNAPPAVLRSAVLYVLRLLAREPLPLNEGLLGPVTLSAPPGSLLDPPFAAADPARCPAVVGGNTETSQRVVDLLLTALGAAAQSQGTMNNVLFGNDGFGYYETVCGGAGATERAPGASAVHSHMTNTRITDPEVLEVRYPVRVEEFRVRRGSGGAGLHRGGDGVARKLLFLAPVALSVLTQHRTRGPRGAHGGADGAAGRQRVLRPDGSALELGPVDGADLSPGDRLLLETPGGGGWGPSGTS